MRIAVSGTAAMGKSTLIKDFLERWTDYKTTEGSYRDKLHKNKHSENTTEATQWEILDWMVDELLKYETGDKIIFDRCPIDNIVYTLWALNKGKVSAQFADKCMDIARESLRRLDMIFIVPFDESIQIEADGTRNPDPEYIREIDAYFQTLYDMYLKNDDTTYMFLPKDDMPVLIPIYGTCDNRLNMIADYIDYNGELIETPETQSVFSEENLATMQQLLVNQQRLLNDETLVNKFKI